MPPLWYAGAPRPASWGTGGRWRALARDGGHVWLLVVDEHVKYTHVPAPELPVVAATGPFRQVAEIVCGEAPDVEPVLLGRLVEPHEPAVSDLAGRVPVAVEVGPATYLGIALPGEEHTVYVASLGLDWVCGLVPGHPPRVTLEPATDSVTGRP